MTVTLLGPLAEGGVKLPLYTFETLAGFASPSAAPAVKNITLAELLEVRAPKVCLAKIEGDSMQGARICDGDLVVVDRSAYAEHGDIVIATLNSEPVCRRLHMKDNVIILQSENSKYPPHQVREDDEFVIWGVVTFSLRDHAKL